METVMYQLADNLSTSANHSAPFVAYEYMNWSEPAVNLDVGPPPYPPDLPHGVLLLQTIVRGLQLYLSPILAVCGLAGNVLCLLCLAMSSNKSSGKCFGTALIAAESLQLLTLLQDWATEMGLDLYVVSGWCHLKMLLADGSRFLSTWYLVCGVVSCLLGNCFPDRDCCNHWRHLVFTLVLAILSVVVYFNISLTATLVSIPGRTPICLSLPEPFSALYYLDHVDAFINVLTPLIVNCLGGMLLVLVKLCCIERPSNSKSQIIGHRYILVHMLLWIPHQVVQLVNAFSNMSEGVTQSSLRGFLWEEIFKHVAYLNMSLNLVLLLALNRVFRKQLKNGFSVVWSRVFSCCTDLQRSQYIGYSSRGIQTSCDNSFTIVHEA